MSDEEIAARGRAALSEMARTSEAFELLKQQYVKAWMNTPAEATDAREKLYQAIRVMDDVWSNLRQMVNDGKLADSEIARIAEQQKVKNG